MVDAKGAVRAPLIGAEEQQEASVSGAGKCYKVLQQEQDPFWPG